MLYLNPNLMPFISCFVVLNSSGTSSMKPKLIPVFDSKPGRAAASFAHLSSAAIRRRYQT